MTEQTETQEKKTPKHREKLEAYLVDQQHKVTIREANVSEDFVAQAPSYLAAAVRHNKAQEVLQKQKLAYDKVVAEVDAELRASGEKTTEAFLAQASKRDERVNRAKVLVIEAEYQAACYQSVVRAWEQKKDMLIQVGSDQRRDYNAQTSLNKPAGAATPRMINGRQAEL